MLNEAKTLIQKKLTEVIIKKEISWKQFDVLKNAIKFTPILK